MQTKKNWFIDLFGPNIIIVVAYFFLLLALFHIYNTSFKLDHHKLWTIFLSTLFVIYSTSTFLQAKKNEGTVSFLIFAGQNALRFIRDWFPVVALVTIYENLREYTGIIRKDSFDGLLYQLDVMIFGVEPTVWIQQFAHPLLTDFFAFVYSIYLILPLSLAWLLYSLNKRKEFHELGTAIILCLCTGFLLYLFVPAGPPRFYIPELFDPPKLHGFFGYYDASQARFDGLNPMVYRASFPSLHVALSAFAMFYSMRFKGVIPFGRFIQYIYAFLVISLWVATVYLRHHWVVDIFAGWAVTIFSIFAASWIQKKWPGPK